MAKLEYFLIAVSSPSAKAQAEFTYSSTESLSIGQLVVVKLRSKKVYGVVLDKVERPAFEAKPIEQVLEYKLPDAQLATLRWAMKYYPFDKGSVVNLFTPVGLPTKKPKEIDLMPSKATDKKLPKLTNDQLKASAVLDNIKSILILHGVTGSGKTMVYIDLIIKKLSKGQSVLLLVPEISLSEQVKAVIDEYIQDALVYSSILSISQRRELWYNLAKDSQPRLIIGPRSSLFLPINNLGAIIIDEAHDNSYKQQSAPYYTALSVAAKLASNAQIPLIYGSATPNTTDYKIATERDYQIIELKERPVATKTSLGSDFVVIDSKERSNFIKNDVLADQVISVIADSATKGTQSLILLNRRGTAHHIQCQNCGWQYRCSVCDHNLVYHRDQHEARCHYCDRKYPMLNSCPIDNGPLKLMTIGTKHVEEICRKLFPSSEVIRLDTDSVSRDSLVENMQKIRSGSIPIIVGTQLIAKGLDLPFLKNIVVLDASRQSTDYLADEHYYQLLHQVIGRGQRGHQQTKILVQTANPTDPIVEWAIKEDWSGFYHKELEERKTYTYPPYCFLGIYQIKRKGTEGIVSAMAKAREELIKENLKVAMLGPVPSPIDGRWQIIAKASSRSTLIRLGELLGSGWLVDLDGVNI